MTTEKFQRLANKMVTDLAAVHAEALSLAEGMQGLETGDTLDGVAGAVNAAIILLEFASERCPAGGFAL